MEVVRRSLPGEWTLEREKMRVLSTTEKMEADTDENERKLINE
jgi:hypothetical protein